MCSLTPYNPLVWVRRIPIQTPIRIQIQTPIRIQIQTPIRMLTLFKSHRFTLILVRRLGVQKSHLAASLLQLRRGSLRRRTGHCTERDRSMLVRTPSGTEGIADVEVSTNTGFGARSEAFTYWMDGTGLTGLVGEFSWFHFVGDYWSSTPQDFGAANFVFLLPTDFEYWQFYSDTMDTCRNNYSLSSSIQVYEPNYGSVQMVAPDGGAVPIPKSIDYASSTKHKIPQYITTSYKAEYSLQAPKAPWPELDITSALRTPNAFGTSPAIPPPSPLCPSSFSLNGWFWWRLCSRNTPTLRWYDTYRFCHMCTHRRPLLPVPTPSGLLNPIHNCPSSGAPQQGQAQFR